MQLDASPGARDRDGRMGPHVLRLQRLFCRTRAVTIAVSDKSSAVARTTLCAASALCSQDLTVGMLFSPCVTGSHGACIAPRVSADTEPLRPSL
jgi:hypothetical protein